MRTKSGRARSTAISITAIAIPQRVLTLAQLLQRRSVVVGKIFHHRLRLQVISYGKRVKIAAGALSALRASFTRRGKETVREAVQAGIQRTKTEDKRLFVCCVYVCVCVCVCVCVYLRVSVCVYTRVGACATGMPAWQAG